MGYLYKVHENGDAQYIAPNGQLSAMVNAEGVVLAPTDRPAALDCYGKTLDELRADSRTLEFERTR
jgi:hypothetical protein